jgi:[NiFe] hydrogenase assembly HybE family chaperone
VSLRFLQQSPAEAVEQTFFRIQQQTMADMPILNPALQVSAVDFQRWQGHWLGIVVTPWCMSLLLLPGSTDNWVPTGQNQRRFVKFAAGDFAFLGGVEAELGEYQSCPLFSPMDRFASQSDAIMTARAALLGLLAPPTSALPIEAAKTNPTDDRPVLSRRRFFALR